MNLLITFIRLQLLKSQGVHGIFTFASDDMLDEETKKVLIRKNAVAIIMPYVRSQLTLLTAQPGVEPIVMPPMNINAILDNSD